MPTKITILSTTLSLKFLEHGDIIETDKWLCAFFSNKNADVRSTKEHEFHQYVKNDLRPE